MPSWINPVGWSVGQATCIARVDAQVLDNLAVAACHAHSGCPGDGAAISGSSVLGGSAGNQIVSQYVTILPFLPASATCAINNQVNQNAINGGWYDTPWDTKGSSAKYVVDCDAGTWTISFYYRTNVGNGIISVCFNGASVGQVDMYGSPVTDDNLSSASSFTLSASGQYTLKFEATASNVSATNYGMELQHIELRRLSA